MAVILKYVMFKYENLYMPVLTPEHVTHKQVALLPSTLCKVVSAGFYNVNERKAFGESESLKLQADVVRDTIILNTMMSGSGTSSYFDHNY